jgi:hypothetical protein
VADRREQRLNPRPTKLAARFKTPGELARYVRTDTIQTPMLDLVDDAIMQADRGDHRFWIINTPPQEGKSTRMQAAGLWLLGRDPSRRVVYAGYEQGLAQVSGLAIRQFVEVHGSPLPGRNDPDRDDVFGFRVDPARGAAGAWALAPSDTIERAGGVISVGVGSALTGKPADVLIVDDPIKDAKHADSETIRKNLKNWWESVATTRLGPNAIVIVVQTRWHEDDLAGWLISEDDPNSPKWKVIAVAAQALAPDSEQGIGPDPLGRAPGEWMISARGRTPEDWECKRHDMGRGGRWWHAMYQQRPAPPEGGVFKREWFKRDRIHSLPTMRRVIVEVDPADNTGEGDEAGIIVAGTATTGQHVVIADYSGHYTVAGWFRRAYFAVIQHNASILRWESSLSRLRQSARAVWKALRSESHTLLGCWRELHEGPFPADGTPDVAVVEAAVRKLARPLDSDEDDAAQRTLLLDLWPHALAVLRLPATGPRVQAHRAEGDKLQRAELVEPLYAERQVSHLGFLSDLEHEMATWMVTQDSPNRMDAVVHVLLELAAHGGGGTVVSNASAVPRHLGVRQQMLPSSASVMTRR